MERSCLMKNHHHHESNAPPSPLCSSIPARLFTVPICATRSLEKDGHKEMSHCVTEPELLLQLWPRSATKRSAMTTLVLLGGLFHFTNIDRAAANYVILSESQTFCLLHYCVFIQHKVQFLRAFMSPTQGTLQPPGP